MQENVLACVNSSNKNVIHEIDLQITTCTKIDREPNMRKFFTGLHITFNVGKKCTVWTVDFEISFNS